MSGIYGHLSERLASFIERPLLFGNGRCVRAEWTAGDLLRAAEDFAAGLAELGIKKGDRVGIAADNHDLWLVADLACMALGAIDVPRAADASEREMAFVFEHSDCVAVIVEDADLAKTLVPALSKIGSVRFFVTLKGNAPDGSKAYDEVAAVGKKRLAQNRNFVRDLERNVGDADLATIVYTSGTTGNPKGVMLSHGNILHNVRLLPTFVGISNEDAYLSFLPSWHTFERTFGYCVLAGGARLAYSSKAALRKDFLKFRPTLMAGVPRLWESIASGVLGRVAKLEGLKKKIADLALGASESFYRRKKRRLAEVLDPSGLVHHPSPIEITIDAVIGAILYPFHCLADRLVYRKVREALGERIRFIVSGGGALPPHVDEFMNRAGICLLNGYGLTETSPVVSVRLPHRNVLLTAGRPLDATEFKVMADDGQSILPPGQKGVLWIKGPQVMQGYYKNDAATKTVMRDGWFNSGDLAFLTDQKDVVICGRVKDTLVLRGGENVEPEVIEAEIIRSPLIADAVVVGHTQKHLGALIVPDPEGIAAGIPNAPKEPDAAFLSGSVVRAALHAEVTRLVSAERGYRVFERVPKIICIPEAFSVEAGTLTPTLKKRRHVIETRYADEIARLFAEDGGGDV